MNTTKIMIAASLLLTIAACKKEEQTKVTVKDKLTAKKWKSTALVVDGTPSTEWCWINSIYEYTDLGTVYETHGNSMIGCGSSTPDDIRSWPYIITANEKYIIIESGWSSSADTSAIISITDTELRTIRYVNDSADMWEETYTAQ